MIIHINPTLKSYLVPEKKTIIFLKHAGPARASIDMNIQWPLISPRCVRQTVLRERAIGCSGPASSNLSSAHGSSKQGDEMLMALTH